jgi:GAF domain-containing protein
MVRLASAVAQCSGPEELLRAIVPLLQGVMEVEVAAICLPGSSPDVFHPMVWDRGVLSVDFPEIQFAGSPSGQVWDSQEPLLIRDLNSETRFSSLGWLAQRHIESLCVVPISTGGRRVGILKLGSSSVGIYGWTFGPAELGLLQWLCGIIALSIENVLTRSALAKEREQMDALVAVQKILARQADLTQALPDISRTLQALLPHCAACVSVFQAGSNLVNTSLFYPAAEKLVQGPSLRVEQSLATAVLQERQVKVLQYQDMRSLSANPVVKLALDRGARSACLVPLMPASGYLGMLAISNRHESAYRLPEIAFLERLSAPLAAALQSSRLDVSRGQQEQRFGILAEINGALLSHESAAKAFARIAELTQAVLPHEYATFELHDKTSDTMVRRILTFPGGKHSLDAPTLLLTRTVGGRVLQAARAMILDEADLEGFEDELLTEARERGIQSFMRRASIETRQSLRRRGVGQQ